MTESKELEFLRAYSTCQIESAVALLRVRDRSDGVLLPGLQQRFPRLGRLVGYAVTCAFSTDPDDARGRRENFDYWNFVHHHGGPKVVVALDASAVASSGSTFGVVNAHIHRALGCRGVVTNGGVRDIEAFGKLGVQVFSAHVTARHGNPHFIGFGEPVAIHGATVGTGDVVCADEHGVVAFPRELLPRIADAAARAARRYQPVLDYCLSREFTPAGLSEVVNKHLRQPPAQPGENSTQPKKG
jgi:4-hydroxy-4-methyl-2-oxoglutarate aldolase